MKTNGTVKMLVLSAVSVVLCLVMLLGATFAWFSSSVTSAKNVISTGTFNVDIKYNNVAVTDSFSPGSFVDLVSASQLYDVTLAPGDKTDVKYIMIKNNNDYTVKVSASIGIATAAGIESNIDELLFYNKTTETPIAFADFTSSDATVLDAKQVNEVISLLDNVELAQGEFVYVAIAVGFDKDAVSTGKTLEFTITVGAEQKANS